MTLRTGSLGETLERLVPFLTVAVAVTVGYFLFVQPGLRTYLRARTAAAALEERARTLRQAVGRGRTEAPADLAEPQREFEARVSPDDKVAEVAAAVARALLDSAPPDKLRSVSIDAGIRGVPPADGGQARAAVPSEPGSLDPRLALFPYAVAHTPLRVRFESTVDGAGGFLWRLRGLPTGIEVRSATLTRGLPLMKTDVLIHVLQRSREVEASLHAPPAPLEPFRAAPTAPRLAPHAGGVREEAR